MNNTHALLLAFIEASGYEVEEVENLIPFTEGNVKGMRSEVDYKVTKKKTLFDINIDKCGGKQE